MKHNQVYYCVFCGNKLNRKRRKYCSNICKCRQFHKQHPDKCNKWNKENPKPRVNNKCLSCGKNCGRKRYCSEICKPNKISEPPYWRELERTNAKCGICEGTILSPHVHHINGNHKDNRKENLIVVCPSCHVKIHKYVLKRPHNDKQREIRRKIILYRQKLEYF